jgi:hypothetical protein
LILGDELKKYYQPHNLYMPTTFTKLQTQGLAVVQKALSRFQLGPFNEVSTLLFFGLEDAIMEAFETASHRDRYLVGHKSHTHNTNHYIKGPLLAALRGGES